MLPTSYWLLYILCIACLFELSSNPSIYLFAYLFLHVLGGAYQSVYVKVRGQFSPTMWVLRTKVMSSYMVTCAFTH